MASKILAIAVSAVLSEDVVDGGEAMSVLQTSGGQRASAMAGGMDREVATADEAVHSFMMHDERVKGLQDIKRQLQSMRIDAKHVKLEQVAEEILNEDITHEQAHQVALMKLANGKSTDETSSIAKKYMVEWVASESGENEDAIEATTEALARTFQDSAGSVRARLEKEFPPGESVEYNGEGHDFPTGDRLFTGEIGTILGANAALRMIRVQFPGNSKVAELPPKDLSKIAEEEEIQFEQGANVVYKGRPRRFADGDRLLPGLTGRVMGDDEAGHRIRVKFDGNREVRKVLRSSLEAQTDNEEDYVKLGNGFCRDADDKPLGYYHATRVTETNCQAHCDSDVLCVGYAFGSDNCAIYSSYSAPEGWKYQAEGGMLSSMSQTDNVDGYACMKKMKQAIQWKLGEHGQSCGEVCNGRCVNNAWPQSEEEFLGIANYSQLQCSEVDKGNADHNPSMCYGRCHWKFAAKFHATPEWNSRMRPRCSSRMSGCSRLCPCQAEVSTIRAEVHTYQVPYRSLGDGFCRDQQAMRPSYYFAHDLSQIQCEQQCDSDRQCTGYTFGGPKSFCAVYSERTEGFAPLFQFHQGEEGSSEVHQVMFTKGHVCMLKTSLEAPIFWNMHQEIEENVALEREKRQHMVEHLLNEMDQFVFMSQREAELNHTANLRRTAAASKGTQAQAGFKVAAESKEEIKAQPLEAFGTLGELPDLETLLEDAGSAAVRLLESVA